MRSCVTMAHSTASSIAPKEGAEKKMMNRDGTCKAKKSCTSRKAQPRGSLVPFFVSRRTSTMLSVQARKDARVSVRSHSAKSSTGDQGGVEGHLPGHGSVR